MVVIFFVCLYSIVLNFTVLISTSEVFDTLPLSSSLISNEPVHLIRNTNLLQNAFKSDRTNFFSSQNNFLDISPENANFFSVNYLRQISPIFKPLDAHRVKEQCELLGCKNGIMSSLTAKNQCATLYRCRGCIERSIKMERNTFCSSFSLPSGFIEIAQGCFKPGSREADDQPYIPKSKEKEKKEQNSKRESDNDMDEDDDYDSDGEESLDDRRSLLELDSSLFESVPFSKTNFFKGKSRSVKDDMSNDSDNGETDDDDDNDEDGTGEPQEPLKGTWVSKGKTRKWIFSLIQQNPNGLAKCFPNTHQQVNLRVDIFLQQATDPDFTTSSPTIRLSTGYTPPNLDTNHLSQCANPVYFENKIKRNHVLRIQHHIPLSASMYSKLSISGLIQLMEKSFSTSFTCLSRAKEGCRMDVYLSCIKLSCSEPAPWKQKQFESISAFDVNSRQVSKRRSDIFYQVLQTKLEAAHKQKVQERQNLIKSLEEKRENRLKREAAAAAAAETSLNHQQYTDPQTQLLHSQMYAESILPPSTLEETRLGYKAKFAQGQRPFTP